MNMNPMNQNALFQVWPKYTQGCEGGELFCNVYGFHINFTHALRKSEKNLPCEGGGAW